MGVLKPPAGQLLIPDPANAWARRGLVGAWLFNDVGPHTHDWSGQGNHGTWDNSGGGMGYAIGEHGRTFEHTGDDTNDRIDLGSITGSDPLKLSSTSAMTVLARVYATSSPNNLFPRLIDISDGGSATNGWQIFLISDDWAFQVSGSAFFNSNAVCPTDQWSTCAFVVEGGFTGGRAKWYINGAVDRDNVSSMNQPPSTTTPGCLVNRNNSTDRQWNGLIDYVYVYNRALSDAEIRYIQLADPYVAFRPEAPASVFAPPVVGGFQAAWAQGSNVLIGAAL